VRGPCRSARTPGRTPHTGRVERERECHALARMQQEARAARAETLLRSVERLDDIVARQQQGVAPPTLRK
jgi:hypothetical protein